MRTWRMVLVAASMAVSPMLAQILEQMNIETSCPNPTGCTNFEIVLSGMPQVNIMATLSDPTLDPFTFVSPATSALTSFVSPQFNFNTVVQFSGSTIMPGTIPQLGPGGNLPHFGLDIVGNLPVTPLEDFWTWPGGGFKTLPLVSFGPGVSCTVPVGDCVYANVFLEFVGGDPQTDGMWVTFLVNPDFVFPDDFPTMANYTGLPLDVTNAGYFLSPTKPSLDELNVVGQPPPGQPGSPFIFASQLLGPIPPTPEPASLLLLVTVGVLIAVKRKSLLAIGQGAAPSSKTLRPR